MSPFRIDAPWAQDVLAAPGGGPIDGPVEGRLRDAAGGTVGVVQQGVVRMDIAEPDDSIAFYRKVGGAHFHERRSVAFAMTTLDTPVYHGYLEEIRPTDPEAIIVDVGGGDGRNALPWLEWGHRRVVVVDPAFDALARFRQRIADTKPEWLERLLLIEADARRLPLASGSAGVVQSIEALAYLNNDYPVGLGECVRVLAADGRLLVADRDFEAGLITRLFYGGGVQGMLSQASGRTILDGNGDAVVTSRCFTAGELRDEVESAGLAVERTAGISGLSLLLGYERANGKLRPDDEAMVDAVHDMLRRLGRDGRFLRSHLVVARRP